MKLAVNLRHTLEVGLGNRSYPIYIGEGLLRNADLLARHLPQRRVAVVSNRVVGKLYLDNLNSVLEQAGIATIQIVLPDGEEHKNWSSLNLIFDQMLAQHCERNTTVIALGGGVVGDMAGFAAATFMRGTPFIQLPTTLLSQVDSSVGGKTAINHPLGKNMIGAFHQPRAVISDTDTLATLPARELSAGLAEVIKYGLIMDLPFFEWLERNLDRLLAREPATLSEAILRSCQNKARIVTEDETEQGVRALLNLGHTFGHAIEAGLGFGTWLHGEAVAAGCMLAAHLSCRVGDLKLDHVRRIATLLQRAKLPVDAPDLGVDRYLDLMGHDKKVQAGKMKLVLMRSIGAAYVTDQIPLALLREVLAGSHAHV